MEPRIQSPILEDWHSRLNRSEVLPDGWLRMSVPEYGLASFLNHIVASYYSGRLDNMAIFVPRLFRALHDPSFGRVTNDFRTETTTYLREVVAFLRGSGAVTADLLKRIPEQLDTVRGEALCKPLIGQGERSGEGPKQALSLSPTKATELPPESTTLGLTKVTLAELSKIKHTLSVVSDTVKRRYPVLVVALAGNYGHGSAGNDDADFIRGVSHGAVAAWHPAAVVFDFRELTYTWGDRLWAVFRDPIAGSQIDSLPQALVISDRCASGFGSSGGIVPKSFRDVAEAIRHVSLELQRFMEGGGS